MTVKIFTGITGGSAHVGKNGFTTYVPRDNVITLNITGRRISIPTCKENKASFDV
jgi:hypothetical protein